MQDTGRVPAQARAAGHSWSQSATVGLLAVLAAKPLLKLGVLLLLGAFLFVGAASSGLGVAGGLLIALLVILFVITPRRKR